MYWSFFLSQELFWWANTEMKLPKQPHILLPMIQWENRCFDKWSMIKPIWLYMSPLMICNQAKHTPLRRYVLAQFGRWQITASPMIPFGNTMRLIA